MGNPTTILYSLTAVGYKLGWRPIRGYFTRKQVGLDLQLLERRIQVISDP
jgi:hypothetical protein